MEYSLKQQKIMQGLSKMLHREIYHRLVCEENQHLLYPLIQDACTSIGYKMLNMTVSTMDGFKYVNCSIDVEDQFCAVMVGFFLDISNIILGCDKDYYLPVVMFCTTYSDNINQYIDTDRSTKHELLHVNDILDMIEKDPDFPEKVRQYSMSKQNLSINDLPKSIEFEMFKMLRLEAKAAREDYKNGENYILIPLKNGEIYRHNNVPLGKFISVKIGSEVIRIKDVYLRKFPENSIARQIILRSMRQAVTKYGKNIFKGDLLKVLNSLK
ncbi:MAG: hypothetical protein H7839_09390 [Magnetococcus sp. YQC-5]